MAFVIDLRDSRVFRHFSGAWKLKKSNASTRVLTNEIDNSTVDCVLSLCACALHVDLFICIVQYVDKCMFSVLSHESAIREILFDSK